MKLASRLLPLEIGAYFVFWIGAVFYSLYRVKCAGKVLENVEDEFLDLSEGWFLIGRKKDVADFEWQIFKHKLFQLLPWLTVSLITSEFLRSKNFLQFLSYFQIIVTTLYILHNFNAKILAFILVQPVVFHLFSKYRSKILIWMCGISFLICLHFYKTMINEPNYLKYIGIDERQHFETMVALAWIMLRCLSYYLCLIDEKIPGNFISILAYCLYLPLLYFGPFVQYKDFEKSHQISGIIWPIKVRVLLRNISRFLFWLVVGEVSLHYVYVNALSYQPELVEKFDPWTLYGFGYAMGQFFHLKYVVMYGISTSLAKFDNIPVPDIPKCIGRIHLYSDMWKYFDRGLYTFLVRYIYIPTRKFTSPYTSTRLHATMLCFAFIYVWHGLQPDILVWTILNYLGVTLEALVTNLYKYYWNESYDQYVNLAWKRRIGCIFAAPLLAMSAISNFYFFGGISIGNIFFKHILHDDFQVTFVLLLTLYCTCQVSSHVKDLEVKKTIKK